MSKEIDKNQIRKYAVEVNGMKQTNKVLEIICKTGDKYQGYKTRTDYEAKGFLVFAKDDRMYWYIGGSGNNVNCDRLASEKTITAEDFIAKFGEKDKLKIGDKVVVIDGRPPRIHSGDIGIIKSISGPVVDFNNQGNPHVEGAGVFAWFADRIKLVEEPQSIHETDFELTNGWAWDDEVDDAMECKFIVKDDKACGGYYPYMVLFHSDYGCTDLQSGNFKNFSEEDPRVKYRDVTIDDLGKECEVCHDGVTWCVSILYDITSDVDNNGVIELIRYNGREHCRIKCD